jgi:hypothetical protein
MLQLISCTLECLIAFNHKMLSVLCSPVVQKHHVVYNSTVLLYQDLAVLNESSKMSL